MSSPSKPGGLKPAKARPLPGRRGVSPAAGSPTKKKGGFHFKLGAAEDDALSPKLLPLPEGAFIGFGSALMPPNEETAGRFCNEGPKLEFGGPMSQADTGCASRIPLRQFAVRLQSAIAQAATLLVDRFQSMSRKEEFTLTQAEDVVKLSYGVQAASYNVQKWAASLGHGEPPQSRPPVPANPEEALAMMNMALPRLVVAASSLQTGLRELVPAVHIRSDGLNDEEELQRLGITIDELYSVVPHMEQMIYQASCLVNSLRHPPPVPPPVPPVDIATERPFGAGPPVEAA